METLQVSAIDSTDLVIIAIVFITLVAIVFKTAKSAK